MEIEGSTFETSEMLATFLASTPLLFESWRMCNHVNNMVSCNFLVDKVGDVGYIAFSSGPTSDLNLITNNNNDCNKLVPIDQHHHNGLFSSLRAYNNHIGGEQEEDEAPKVHAGFLNHFLSLYNSIDFQNQRLAVMEQSKAIVITGHSIGGTTASLTTLWFLCCLQSLFPPRTVLCITFGSPLLGNESLSRAILRERWGGKFCHMVSKHDIVPRLLFAPFPSPTPELYHVNGNYELHRYVLGHVASVAATAQENSIGCPYMPFGSYLFCSKEGAVCIDNVVAIVRVLHLMFLDASTDSSCIEEHLGYGEVVRKFSQQILMNKCSRQGLLHGSCYEEGVSLALEALGLAKQDFVTRQGRNCLMDAMKNTCKPNLNSADLSIRLAKVTPYRAEIEWYKARCDDSGDQLGYYDTFKLFQAKRDQKVNLNRIKLAKFWDQVLNMIETNQLPHDFHRRAKFVNASQFYKLLVEPLDIANYYRSEFPKTKCHYMTHGRERRYKIFDKWWDENGTINKKNYKRNKYAGLTQDSCFWARLEEANEWLKNIRTENSLQKRAQFWEDIENFQLYAKTLVDKKEVSRDVVASNSSYSIWLKEWKELKPLLVQPPPGFYGQFGGQVVQ